MPRQIRTATRQDAEAMAEILNRIIAIGGTTAFRQSFDVAGIVNEFIEPARAICCFLAVEEGQITGFQSLVWSDPDWTGPEPLPADWAVIATFVDPQVQSRGTGSDLFRATERAARKAGVHAIDATIRRENTGGLTYYGRMGFADYCADAERISKRLDLT